MLTVFKGVIDVIVCELETHRFLHLARKGWFPEWSEVTGADIHPATGEVRLHT